jgi:bacterioferritin
MQTLDPLMIGQDIKAVLVCDLKAENSARALYVEARDFSRGQRLRVHGESLLQDEEGYTDFLETQIDLINTIGIQNYGLLQSTSPNEGDKTD